MKALSSMRSAVAAWRDGPDVPFPRSLVYDMTLDCNLSCPMCLYQGRGGPQRPFTELAPGFARIVDRFDHVYIIGAEPMMRDDLADAIAWFRKRGKAVTVQSNGTINRPEVIASVDRFDTSLDGAERTNDAIRGPGSHSRTMAAIRCALEAGNMGTVSAVALEENLDQIEPLALGLGRLGVAGLDLSPVVRYSPQEIASMEALGFSRDEVAMPPGAYGHRFRRDFRRLTRRLSGSPSVTLSPSFLWRDSGPFFDGRRKRGQACGAVYSLRIGPAGEVIHCAMIRRPFGTILGCDPADLWRGPMLAFRRRLYRDGLYPVCYRCCKRSWIW